MSGSGDEVRVRACRPGDIGEVLALWTADRSHPASVADDRAALERLLAHDDASLILAERDGRIVATLIVAWDGWRGNMYRLVVASDQRRRGIARKLVAFGEEDLRARGARRVSALVTRGDDPAAALWAALGYWSEDHIARFARNL